jgi:hypothetical protein
MTSQASDVRQYGASSQSLLSIIKKAELEEYYENSRAVGRLSYGVFRKPRVSRTSRYYVISDTDIILNQDGTLLRPFKRAAKPMNQQSLPAVRVGERHAYSGKGLRSGTPHPYIKDRNIIKKARLVLGSFTGLIY